MHNSHSAQYSIIFGLGQTGLSCVRYCHEKNIPLKVVDTGLKSSDLIDFQNNFPGIELYLGALTPSDFESILEKAASNYRESRCLYQRASHLIGS